MELLNFCGYAEGYYSGSAYEENIMIPAKTFEDLPEEAKTEIKELHFYVGELDGKHSEVESEDIDL